MQALDAAVETEVRHYNERPRLSFQVLARDQEVGKDTVEAKAILEATWQRLRLTGNGAYAKKGSDDGGNASIEMEWNPSREVRLEGRGPLRLALAGRGEWMEDIAPIYKGQLKVTFPLWDGLEVPVSFTVANRTELVDETEVRGLVGFSLDTTRLLAWLGRADGEPRP
jgi:hypothetical protein